MGHMWEDTGKSKPFLLLTPIGDGAVQWERELDYSFLLPNCNFLFRLFQEVICTMV